ncbi:hypothetical protein ACFELO_00095 [Oceanicaulis sp. LC35]|uniref:hypothetical protein n=1 Tax=Oceanicaulis sp. LC35 TaxID=3349635 RepID=UPI003F82A0BA
MMIELLGLAGFSALLATGAGYAGRWGWRGWRSLYDAGGTPVAAVALPPFRPLTPGAFVSSNDQGAFGEALTHIMMAQAGWRPINGKPGTGPQGIDGVFVRHGEDGLEACLIETKTNASRYTARQMSDAKLGEDLTRLYVTCGDPALGALYAWLYTALAEKDPAVSKQLWRHHLARGATEQLDLDRAGETTGPVRLAPCHVFIEALAASLDELDRGRRYWTGLYPS